MEKRASFRMACIALLSLSFVFFLGKAYETSLRGIDSNIHARVSLNVTSSGMIPHLPMSEPNSSKGSDQAIFNDHPFFFFWINGGIMRALGPSAWSARILTAATSVACVMLTLALGTLLHSPFFGFLSACFYLFTRDIILTGATVSLDPPMLAFILLSFLFWAKRKWTLVGIACGIGLWIKTPVVLLIFPTATLFSLIKGQLKSDFPKIVYSGVIALTLGSVIWIVTGLIGGWSLPIDYWRRQVWGTAVNGRNLGFREDWYMLFRLVWRGFIPGLPFLLLGLFQIVRKKKWKETPVLISFLSILVLFITITPMRFRMDYYYNPAFPFLAFLASFSCLDFLKPYESQTYKAFTGTALLLMSLVLCAPVSFGPEAYPALRKFTTLIQTYGHEKDKILLIPGGEPLGSSHDSRLFLNFYLGKHIEIETCDQLKSRLREQIPDWVILSKENFNQCISENERSQFASWVIYKNQLLLSNLVPGTKIMDLTPMEKELHPSF